MNDFNTHYKLDWYGFDYRINCSHMVNVLNFEPAPFNKPKYVCFGASDSIVQRK
jgi:hypothetical protein